jgi:hypothetical protein
VSTYSKKKLNCQESEDSHLNQFQVAILALSWQLSHVCLTNFAPLSVAKARIHLVKMSLHFIHLVNFVFINIV